MFREGSQIGLYTLIRKLGRGGFGEVWLAERRAKFVTTKVAVKLPHDEQVNREAIKQEATLWEQASGHPNIMPIIDADEYDGQVVIVSEFAPDGSLDEWLKRNGKMSVERAVETTIKILDGLEFLHSRNIIHRDLKPANILLQGETPRLADFGISRALRTTVASQSQNISGTFAYMSPEALDGKRSIQTDIWSVGVNLYQFLTGVLPYPQKEPSALIAAIMMREFEPLPDSIPQSVKNVVAKALAKLPENRYASAGEMREDLRRILRGEAVSDFIQSDSRQTTSTEQLLPQKVASLFSQNFQSETEMIISSQEKFGQNEKRKDSKGLLYSMLALLLIGLASVTAYFINLNQSKELAQGANTKNANTENYSSTNNTSISNIDSSFSTKTKNINLAKVVEVSKPSKSISHTASNKAVDISSTSNLNKTKNNSIIDLSKTNNESSNNELQKQIYASLQKKGYFDITVEINDNLVILRGSVPKGRLADAIIVVQTTSKRPVKNMLWER